MGYPMTFRRLLNRNGLTEGNYGHSGGPSLPWQIQVNLTHPGLLEPDKLAVVQWPYAVDRLKRYESQAALLLGDLRRLESDTVDEGWICKTIASKTGVDPDTVAAVLKEWLNT